jgi:hypothetical protein
MEFFTMPSNTLEQFLLLFGTLFAIFFIVLLILVPFYVQSINTWSRTSAKELKKIRELLVLMRQEKELFEDAESTTPSMRATRK